MRLSKAKLATGILCGASVLALATLTPVQAQERPESLLPPGFEQPAQPKPAQPQPAQPKPAQGGQSSGGQTAGGSPPPKPASSGGQAVLVPGGGDAPDVELTLPVPNRPTPTETVRRPTERVAEAEAEKKEEDEDPDAELAAVAPTTFDVPAAAARSLKSVGLITGVESGFSEIAFGPQNGEFVHGLMAGVDAPMVSRWATIMGRRLLVSQLATPEGISGQQFVADRAWMLLKMGESNLARALMQQVDAGKYTSPMYRIALPVYLASGDPAGACPLVEGGVAAMKGNSDGKGKTGGKVAAKAGGKDWRMMRPICASLSGEQGRADALFSSARGQRLATGVDLLLAEKVIGVSSKRRAVTINWDGVKGMNTWRHGLSLTTGLLPPERLYKDTGPQTRGWLAVNPAIPAAKRADAALIAGALGNLSNAAMVGLYAEAASDETMSESVAARANALEIAYVGEGRAARLDGLRQLFPESGKTPTAAGYGQLVLASRAAAAIAPDDGIDDAQKDWLIAAMVSSGLDRQAAMWFDDVATGSLGWAIIAASAPGLKTVAEGDVESFIGNDESAKSQKSKLLVAGLAGLGRVSPEFLVEQSDDLGTPLVRKSAFGRLITDAAKRGEAGTVALLSMLAMQGTDWAQIKPDEFFQTIRALKAVGLEAEARMLVAEAVTRA
jgi:hypothetical protein